MKGNHLTLLFAILALALLTISDLNTEELSASIKSKFLIEEAFMTAIDAATKQLLTAVEENDILAKERASQQFFKTLATSLGIFDSPSQQELLKLCIPAIAVTTKEGFYILYNDEYDDYGKTGIKRIWTELVPYSYEDDNFIYRLSVSDYVILYDKKDILGSSTKVNTYHYQEMQKGTYYSKIMQVNPDNILLNEERYYLTKQNAMIEKLEAYLSYYVNKNNDIASQFGVTYQFIIPEIDHSEWVRSIHGLGMIVIFQGFPYSNGREYYNQFVITGANIKPKDTYYIVAKDWYYEYHKEGCNWFMVGTQVKTCNSLEDCAYEGAYACKYCCLEGVVK